MTAFDCVNFVIYCSRVHRNIGPSQSLAEDNVGALAMRYNSCLTGRLKYLAGGTARAAPPIKLATKPPLRRALPYAMRVSVHDQT